MAVPVICHVSTLPPTQCGIATYASDLISHLPHWRSFTVRMTFDQQEPATGHHLQIAITAPDCYTSAASLINASNVGLVSLQHEFGIYGGEDGEHVLLLLDALRIPIVTTLHTVAPCMSAHQAEIIRRIARLSKCLIVLSEQSREVLCSAFGVDPTKVMVVPHGVPHVPFIYPEQEPLRSQHRSGTVFVSAGHTRPSKGYHLALAALAEYRRYNAEFSYLILGSCQPQYCYGRPYEAQILGMIDELGLATKVFWVQEYLHISKLLKLLTSADIGLVTYTESDQASSGIIPLFLACGRPVIATPFAFAVHAASSLRGVTLAPRNDPRSICEQMVTMTQDRTQLTRLMQDAYRSTRAYLWPRVGEAYDKVFRIALG